MLDALELSGLADLAGAEVIDHARACFRARNQATARFLTALHEAGRAVDGQKGRRALLDEFSGDEAAAALGWSRAMASRWLDLAEDLLRRLPEVHAAMRGGELDDSKARVISDWTRDLADDHAHHVCAVVLPEAPGLTVSALIERIQQVATALDPQWAERRERTAEKQARVLSSRNPVGHGERVRLRPADGAHRGRDGAPGGARGGAAPSRGAGEDRDVAGARVHGVVRRHRGRARRRRPARPARHRTRTRRHRQRAERPRTQRRPRR
ncbi:DUF222 domain-containing protein [Actinomycetospora succinea]|uniref:DUF222 domain-containing protein n=1 Tax=Actinomycetospora succinea TaxID=663603 RepID=UPI001414E36F|nr:DUF222 domain-containing protein [Actinomycetospora succinea]